MSKEQKQKIRKKLLGHKITKKTRKKISKSLTGHTPWNKGKKLPQMCEEKHPMWKGDNVGYYGLHSWINKKLGKPKKCDICGTEKEIRYEWANISKKYMRCVDDWKRLCVSCHRRYDRRTKN